MVDADSFASLVILNRNWYNAAQVRELYAHHLSRCPSYALANTVITGPFRKFDLYRLKTKFAAEVRRNLFQAYLRPRQTLINLISVNASSSAALPGAEAFRFSFSPNGQTILALSSSRIYVIDAITEPISVRHELKTMRRPLAASVTDDGTILAVLSSKHQANVYHLTTNGVRHVQVLVMDNPPRTIALAPEGTVLAAAYEGGVEVFSLAPSALSTDRRAVRSEGVDCLSFSGDGSMLVGSTQSLEEPSAVVITAPFYTENDLPPKEIHSRMWTTQILFPQISSICSHAELLQGHTEGDANWIFAYDHTLMSYRAVRTDDTRTGVAYFLNPTTNRRFSLPAPSTAPTATVCGTLVVAGFSGSGLWIYGVPEKLDVAPDMGSVVERHEQRLQGRVPLTSATGHIEPLMAYSPSVSGSSDEIEDDSLAAKVEWRESLFVKCQPIRSLDGATAAKWVERIEERPCAFEGKRLIVVAPGGVDQFAEELGDEAMPVDGSRLSILDFDYAPSSDPDRELTIEVGEKEAELLMEQIGDMDIEVAMERRRTVRDRARGGMRVPLGRSITTASANSGSRLRSVSQASSPLDVDAQIALANSMVRVPMSPQQQSPNLHRSATAAGFSTARFPPRPPLAQQQAASPPQQLDGWESPPPPYNTPPLPHHQTPVQLGSPLIQPRAVSGMPLVGIPENGHAPQVHPGFGHGHPMHHQASFSAISAHNAAQIPPVSAQSGPVPSQFAGQYGASGPRPEQTLAPVIDTFQRVNPISQVHPATTNSFAPSASDGSSRPVSNEGRISPYQQHTPVSQRLQTSDRPSPITVTPSVQTSYDGAPAPTHSASNSLTLTGANLQARLNQPVPPTPTSLQRMSQAYDDRSQPVSQQFAPPPANQVEPSYAVPTPTNDQIANLNRRISQTTRKPVASIVTNGAPYTNGARRDLNGGPGVPPSPPAGAWGAAGVPGSPSFNKAISTPNGLMRSNSRGSGRSIPVSNSTPNLHAAPPVRAGRPGMGRLETIDSVASAYPRGDPHLSPRGTGQPSVTLPHSAQYPLSQPPFMPPQSYQQMPIHQVKVWAGDGSSPTENGGRRVLTDPTQLESSNKKKGKKKKGEEIPRSQTPMPTSSGPVKEGKKKGGRCVVM